MNAINLLPMKHHIKALDESKLAKSNYATAKPAVADKDWDKLSKAAEVARFSIWMTGALKKASTNEDYNVGSLRNDVVREVKAARVHLGKELVGIPEKLLVEVDQVLWKRANK